MISEGAIITSWGGFQTRMKKMALSSEVMGVRKIALGIRMNFFIYLTFMGICGVAMPIFNTPTTVLLQEKIEEDYLGRVVGVRGMISTSMMPIGMLIFGPISDMIKIEWLLLGTG